MSKRPADFQLTKEGAQLAEEGKDAEEQSSRSSRPKLDSESPSNSTRPPSTLRIETDLASTSEAAVGSAGESGESRITQTQCNHPDAHI